MSPDMGGFLSNIKRAAIEAVEAKKPFAFLLGTVTSEEPLKVQVDQKMELTSAHIILTNAVRDFTVKMTVDHETENALSLHSHEFSLNTSSTLNEPLPLGYSGITDSADLTHKHSYSGTKTFRVHLGLKAGERVLLLRTDGGQKYIILDRVEAPE